MCGFTPEMAQDRKMLAQGRQRSPDEDREYFNLSRDYPMVAPN
jgi:predicted transcriptional regulator